MDNQIIVLIDVERRIIRLFGKYTREIPFGFAFTLPSLVQGEDVLYITNAEQVSGEDIVNVMTSLIRDDDFPQEKLYIRSKQEGYVRIPELKITFSGPKDAKPIENYGFDLLERSGTLRKMWIENKIEIMTESVAKGLKKAKLDPKAKDKALDSILINNHKDITESDEMFGPGGGEGDEVSDSEDVLSEAETILKEHREFGKDRKKE